MSYISVENLNSIHAELSNFCNAACPMCSRFDWDGNLQNQHVNSHNITVDLIANQIGPEVISKLKLFLACGTFGDSAVNPECLEIFQYVRKHNPTCRLVLNTNGGTRPEKFWSDLGKITNTIVVFSIDGLEDTNHLYRKNVVWHQLIRNMKAFIKSGGTAVWRMIIFRHNEHQVNEAEELAYQLGCKEFSTEYSARWKQRNWVETDKLHNKIQWAAGGYYLEQPLSQPSSSIEDNIIKKFNFETTIHCKVCTNDVKEIYLRADGQVQPCCMVGETERHEIGRLLENVGDNNLHKNNLKTILEGSFFRNIENGISGGPTRLQNCFHTCGLNEEWNFSNPSR
jgi:MoaA/NifB/PqqE/SkfB family radical SAM enzyme